MKDKHQIHTDHKSVILGKVLGWLIRLSCWTLRLKIIDDVNLSSVNTRPLMMLLWHNRIMIPPFCLMMRKKKIKVTVLTSASRDGTILASAMSVFGLGAIRGSSSRRGVAALIAMKQALEAGESVCVTPDGPRGPMYQFQEGSLALARKTNALIAPIKVQFSKHWTLNSWDQFKIPHPFSKVTVHFMEPKEVPEDPELYQAFVKELQVNMTA